MLNIFPTVWLSLFAYAFMRIVLGSIFLYLGYHHLTKDRTSLRAALAKRFPKLASFGVWHIAVLEAIAGGMLVLGMFTQIAAILAIALSLKMLFLKKYVASPVIPPPLFYILALAMSISLFITGAGAFAFDLPL